MSEVHENCLVVQFLFSYFLNLFLMKLHLYLKKCYEEPVLLHCCIPDAIDWQQGRSERRAQ